MAGRLSFSIAINLLTENFKSGTSQVKQSLKSMQMQVLTFAAAVSGIGLGLDGLISRLIATARETSKVTTALKNVSGSTANFATNQKFLVDLSKKYGIEVLALTGNYAKFTAAATNAGMSLDNQKKIFDSVSRACIAFGMSADDTNLSFLAITQMMSKGKISSEELRRQLGERMPIAMAAMAKAAGVPIQKLDKLLQQGELMSADILPKFAAALTSMIPNVNTDNIETSINNLQNAFTEFTKGTGIQSAFKSLIDGLTNMVSYAGGNIKNIAITVASFIVGSVLGKIYTSVASYFSKVYAKMDTFASKAATAEAQVLLATQNRVKAQEILELANARLEIATTEEKLAAKKAANSAEMAFNRASAAEKKAIIMSNAASEAAAQVSSLSRWGRFWVTVGTAAKTAWASIQAMWNSFAPMIIITAITYFISKLVQAGEEAKRVKEIFSQYQQGGRSATNTQEIIQLKVIQELYNKANGNLELQQHYRERINSILGTHLKGEQAINSAIKDRIRLLEATAKLDYYTNQNIQAHDTIDKIISSYGGKGNYTKAVTAASGENYKYSKGEGSLIKENFFNAPGTSKTFAEISRDKAEVAANMLIIQNSERQIKANIGLVPKDPAMAPYTPPAKKVKETPLEKAEDKYAKDLLELKAKLKLNIMSSDEYDKAFDELNKNALIEAMSLKGNAAKGTKYLSDLQSNVAHPRYNEKQARLNTAASDYSASKWELDNKRAAGDTVMTQKEYDTALDELIKSTLELTGSIMGTDAKATELYNRLMIDKKPGILPTPKERDSTYDYKLSKPDLAADKRDNAKENAETIKSAIGGNADELAKDIEAKKLSLEELKNKYQSIAPEMVKALNDAMNNVDNLEDALKIATVKKDIEDLGKEINKGVYSGVKDVASSADRMVSSFQNIRQVFSNVDATGWEKIMAVWDAMTSTVDSFLSILEMVKNLTDLFDKLAAAKKAESAIQTATTSAKVTAITTEAAAQVTAIGTVAAAQTAASLATTEASTVAMAAESTAAYAYIPFAGVGLAAGQIAAMQALIAAAAIPKFAAGGVVGGSSYQGDKILARLNSGELVLNRGQQSTLFGLLNSRESGTGQTGVKVRGSDLYLTLKNYTKQTGKKL